MEVGTREEFNYRIKDSDLASAIGVDPGDAFPRVFATSRMVALMEIAAARLMQPLLKPDELSVGVGLDVKHTAPTPNGAEVRVLAEFTGKEGKLYAFRVEVFDPGGKVGECTHRRAVIETERLLAGAKARGS